MRGHMVCEWAWVSILGERDLPKSLNWRSPLGLRSHAQVRTHTGTPDCHGTQTKSKIKIYSNSAH